MNRKHIQVNGFRAEVLSESYLALRRLSGPLGVYRVLYNGPEAPSTAQRRKFLADADAAGYDTVVVERHLHVKYDLRCTMRARSGSLVYVTTHQKNAAGVWYAVRSSRRSIY